MFYLLQREISEVRRQIGAKFCTVVSTRPNFIMPVKNFATKGMWAPKLSPQSDLGRRANSRWALLQISSLTLVYLYSEWIGGRVNIASAADHASRCDLTWKPIF